MTEERMTDAGVAKVDANAKADASDASEASNINTPKNDVTRGIGKPCAVAIVSSQRVSLRQQDLRDSQSDCEGADTGNFYAKKEATKSGAKQKSDAISTCKRFSLRKKAFRETRNLGLG